MKLELRDFFNDETKELVNKFNLQLENEGIKINEAYKRIEGELQNPSDNPYIAISESNNTILCAWVVILNLLKDCKLNVIPLIEKELKIERIKVKAEIAEMEKNIRESHRELYEGKGFLGLLGMATGAKDKNAAWGEEYEKVPSYKILIKKYRDIGSINYLVNANETYIKQLGEAIRINLMTELKGKVKTIATNLMPMGGMDINTKNELY